jgi:hypothetical protein
LPQRAGVFKSKSQPCYFNRSVPSQHMAISASPTSM